MIISRYMITCYHIETKFLKIILFISKVLTAFSNKIFTFNLNSNNHYFFGNPIRVSTF